MNAPWCIELLGCLRATQDGRAVTRFRSGKAAALLAYLAYYRDRVHAREELMELPWADCQPTLGRKRLRVELSSLRKEIEPSGVPAGCVLLTDPSFVQLSPTAVTTDVARFQASLEAARASAGAEQAQHLAAA